MSAHHEREKFANPVVEWIDQRLPVFTMLTKEYGVFPMPKTANYLWSFGGIALTMLLIMIVSGVFLAMSYTPETSHAFNSVERIMRDVNYGWLLRYVHMNGASFFFIAVYIHIARGLYYGSYHAPREILWMVGVIIFLLMMATAFMGYALPWSQMSGWGVTVITSLFSAFPLVGDSIMTWLWGGFGVGNPTLNRFFALHFLLPFVILGVVFIHVWALHVTKSNNPTGVEAKTAKDTVPFHPYFTAKDGFAVVAFLTVFLAVALLSPLSLTEYDHFKPFDPMVTPSHIVPEWYFLPFYAILRAFTMDITIPFTSIIILPAKLQGVLGMFSAILLLMVLPWLDGSPVKSASYRPIYRKCLGLLLIAFLTLGYVGAKPPEGALIYIGQIATFYYFAHFIFILPVLSRREKTIPLPESIDAAYRAKHGGKGKAAAIALFAVLSLGAPAALAADAAPRPPQQEWAHKGVTGTFDRAALQRGFQVYKEVCAACHGLNLLSYRNLEGLGYSAEEIKAIAAEYTVTDGPNDEGDMFERPAVPADRFKAPFANDAAARAANGGALPPDMSLIVRSRPYGEDYIYALLTGYAEAPAGVDLTAGMYWNKYFPGHQIAMAPPLMDGQLSFADGTEATVGQMAHDVASFLAFAAEPHMEARKQLGLKVVLFMLVFTGIMYGVKRKVWQDVA